MKHLLVISLSIVFSIFSPLKTSGVAYFELDLAEIEAETELRVEPGIIQIEIKNKLPLADYEIQVDIITIPIPPLGKEIFSRGNQLTPNSDNCKWRFDDLVSQTLEENQVPDLIVGLKEVADECPELKNECLALINSTHGSVESAKPIKTGEKMIVTITRLAKEVKDGSSKWSERSWKVVLSTGDRGKWIATYGMTFVQNRDEKYYVKKTDKTAIVAQETKGGDFIYQPSVLLNWIPNRYGLWGGNVHFSPAAGIGFQQDSPSLFAGLSVIYNWNIALTAGCSIFQQNRLVGRYHCGDEISPDLGDSQLNRKVYSYGYFLGLTFRFGEPPFQPKAIKKSSRNQAQPTPTPSPIPSRTPTQTPSSIPTQTPTQTS